MPKLVSIEKEMLSESKFFMGYSRWNEEKNRYETWDEAVQRVMDMHRQKYSHVMTDELEEYISFAEQAYKEKIVLGAQRALQFGGEQIFRHPNRLYNCAYTQADRTAFFQETMYLLLCGCGVGFSVQKHHIAKLPKIKAPDNENVKVHVIEDSIEGWADAFGALISSYFVENQTFPQYANTVIHFDSSLIRPRGAYISGGFKAPGPDGLMRSLDLCRKLLDDIVKEHSEPVQMRPIVAYDFVMHMADAVLSGGIRRAATICIFGKDDTEMMKAKTGDWFITNPQRGRSNNSVLLIRDELTRGEWSQIMQSVRDYGEPGFIFAEDKEFGFNPLTQLAA